jgi:hypothetical protein
MGFSVGKRPRIVEAHNQYTDSRRKSQSHDPMPAIGGADRAKRLILLN